MNKNFYQIKKEREDWAKKILLPIHSLLQVAAKDIREKLFKRLRESNIELSGKRIVQLGCMEGYLIKSLMEKGAYVHAVDFSRTMLNINRKRLSPAFDNRKYQLS